MKSGSFSKWGVVLVCACAAAAVAGPARVTYVDAGAKEAGNGSSWADACIHLQDALASAAAAEKPVEIRVAKGVYKPDQGAGINLGDRTATFKLVNGVTLTGGYAGATASDPDARDVELYETILSGDLAGNDNSGASSGYNENSLYVVTGSGTDHSAVIDGFTITAGFTHWSPSPPTRPFGGAGLRIDAGSPTVLRCCFRDNLPSADGVLLAANGSHPIVTDCTFLHNQGKGVSCVNKSNPVVTNCRFEDNDSGSMDNQDSSPIITGCQFTGSRRCEIQAIYCDSTLTDCVFTGGDNRLGQGIHFIGGRATLTGCTFTDFQDGAMETSDELTLVRCTFRNNSGFLAGAVRGFRHGLVTALDCTFVGNDGSLAGAIYGGDTRLHDCEFIGNSGHEAGAVTGGDEVFIAAGCVFAGNSGGSFGAGAISSTGEVVKVSNCTFVGNRGKYGAVHGIVGGPVPMQVTQCIVRDEPQPFGSVLLSASKINVAYSNIRGGYPGEGNIDVDPCFVDPGCWTDPNDPNAVWITGDYHLKSQAGHWDRASQSWVQDDVTSLCIDAGDPNAPVGVEPFPNGGFINLGAYGGSAEASKSYFGKPVCESQIGGDINGDCIVDQADLDILQLHWLMDGTGFINSPPTVTLLSPKDGDELTEPAPILFQAVASDSDGVLLRVKYTLEYRTANMRSTSSTWTTDPANNWDVQWQWSNIRYDGTYTVWAEVMDNEGAKAISPTLTVTLHPAKKP